MLKEVPSTPALMPSKPSLTGNIAKVASLVAIVIGGHGFAQGEPRRKKRAGRCCRRNRHCGTCGECPELAVGRVRQFSSASAKRTLCHTKHIRSASTNQVFNNLHKPLPSLAVVLVEGGGVGRPPSPTQLQRRGERGWGSGKSDWGLPGLVQAPTSEKCEQRLGCVFLTGGKCRMLATARGLLCRQPVPEADAQLLMF
jgi:hypothetical protein